MLAADHAGDHVNACLVRWENLSDSVSEDTCDAPAPADLVTEDSGDAGEPCFLPPQHVGRCTNGMRVWGAAEPEPVPRTELILALLSDLSAGDVEVIRPFLRSAEWQRPDAPDCELMAEALAKLDACWGAAGA
jgi:hypothetical protein